MKASGSVKDAKDPVTSKSDAVKSEGTKPKVKSEDDAPIEDDDEEEKESVKKESVSIPKLKSEIFTSIVDHMKGLKKEDLAKMYGSMMVEQEPVDTDGDDKEDSGDTDDEAESTKVKKESIDQIIDKLDVSQDVEALIGGEEEMKLITFIHISQKN